jgi:hypothetical protein
MFWLYACIIGLAIGMITGWAAEQIRVAPLAQSLAASFTAILLAIVATAVVWFLRPPATGGLGAVSIGLPVEGLVYLALLMGVVTAVHFCLGLASGPAAPLARHRPMILGILGGLCGATLVARMMAATGIG